MRDEAPAGLRAQFAGKTVTMWLFAINLVVYVLDQVLHGSMRAHAFAPTEWGSFTVFQGITRLQLWRLVTYQFIHSYVSFFHIFFNMAVLLSFGPIVERLWGSCRFLAFYLACGLVGVCLFIPLSYFPQVFGWSDDTQLIGASGSILGIMVAVAVMFPTMTVGIPFTPIRFPAPVMAWVCVGISALSLIVGSMNAGGEAAHIGGIAMGYLLAKQPWLLGWLPREFSLGGWFQRARTTRTLARGVKQRRAEADEEAEVDRILDKVRAHGLHSLTRGEKKALDRASERLKSL
ncbi:MAG: rhomboid family intramembrane serine protease [Planctomycetes bacterium]|nr:rhomboid family intramembrane serine protease [Planctomycetota bacterium]